MGIQGYKTFHFLSQKSFTKSGYSIYQEIGPGKRIALAKLALDKFEETGRPLRIAVDVSIWNFQIQSGKGKSFDLHSHSRPSFSILMAEKRRAGADVTDIVL